MDITELYQLCGISATAEETGPRWIKAEMRFIGEENYVLGSKDVEVTIEAVNGGLSYTLRNGSTLEAKYLLGNKAKTAVLCDVQIVLQDFTLSLANSLRGRYPKMLRKNETLSLLL